MQITSKELEAIIKGDNRKYAASLCFSFSSLKNPESAFIRAPGAQDGCVPDQIVFPYLNHIQNRLFSGQNEGAFAFPSPQNIHKDGNLHQVTKRPYSHIGYIGAKADSLGFVDDTVSVYFFPTNIKKISIKTNPDRIIKDACITAKTRAGKIIGETSITENKEAQFTIDFSVSDAASLELHITKHTPNKRVWLLSFYPGFEFFVDEKDIVKIRHKKKKTENKEGAIGRVYIDSLNITLSNTNRIYDDLNSMSPVAGYFNPNAILSCTLKLETPKDVEDFFLDFGTYFVKEIKNPEGAALVEINAQDYIGLYKTRYLALGVEDNTSAATCFTKIANALNLSASKIDPCLHQILLRRIPLSGTAGSLLNKLAVLTNAFVSVDKTGAALVATPMLSRHSWMRYPLRYFLTDEYKQGSEDSRKSKSPNVVNLSYNEFEYEGEYQAGQKDVIFYNNIPILDFPQSLENIPFELRAIGAGLAPSLYKEYDLSRFESFVTVEFSDSLIPKLLEYDTQYVYNEYGKPVKACVSVWNFEVHEAAQQLTIMLMIMGSPHAKLLKKEEFTVSPRAATYIIPPLDNQLNTMDMTAIETRNKLNKPEVFKVELRGGVKIRRVDVANRFVQRRFEFTYYQTAEGIEVRVWNYYNNSSQTVTVNIYGNRLIDGKNKKKITARNEEDIQKNGVIEKTIEAGSFASDDIARSVLKSMAYYYRHFTTSTSLQIWADPRLDLYDLVAFKSLRGYGFYQGIIDEMDIEYNGALTQKIKIKQTKKHSRDSRVLGGCVLGDRPVLSMLNINFA